MVVSVPFPSFLGGGGVRERHQPRCGAARRGRYRGRMPNEDTAPIPVHSLAARPGTRAVAFLAVSGVLLIVSTFVNLVSLPGVGGESLASITGWGLDLGIGHTIQQYVGVITLVCGAALIVIAAASLRAEFRWTRNASLVAGGLGVAAGLFLSASGYSTGVFLAEIAGVSGQDVAPRLGIGIWLALLGSACALVAIASPVRRDPIVVELPPMPDEDVDAPVVYRLDEPEESEEPAAETSEGETPQR